MKYTPEQQQIYDLYLATPPESPTSGGLASAYFTGLNTSPILHRTPYIRDSLAFAAFRAGRKHRAFGVPE